MPTIQQLVRKNRKDKVRKSNAPVLGMRVFVYQMEKK